MDKVIKFTVDELELMIKVIVFANQNMLIDDLEKPILPFTIRKFRKLLAETKELP